MPLCKEKIMQGQSQGQIGHKDVLTKILAVAGTVLVWVPILAPVLLSVFTLLTHSVFHFDFLMPGELFPVVIVGGGLLVWAAQRACSRRKQIGWSLGIAVGTLVGSQALAIITRVASGATESDAVLGVVIAVFSVYILAVIATGVGGGLLIRDLFK
jgi:hypothetical protein